MTSDVFPNQNPMNKPAMNNRRLLKAAVFHFVHPDQEDQLKTIFILQKKAVRVMTFSSFDHHSSQLFKSLEIIKFSDLVTFVIATFMYKFHNQLLPSVFQSFFTRLDTVHSYHTRLSAKQSYYLPKARTNYGKFNIQFQGPKIWNAIDYDIKHLPISSFKIKLKQSFLQSY